MTQTWRQTQLSMTSFHLNSSLDLATTQWESSVYRGYSSSHMDEGSGCISSPITSDGQGAQPRCIYHLEDREREENSLPPCWSARKKNTFHLIHEISYFSCHGEGVRAKAFPQLFLISRNVDKSYSMDQVRNICSRNRKISPILQVHHPWKNIGHEAIKFIPSSIPPNQITMYYLRAWTVEIIFLTSAKHSEEKSLCHCSLQASKLSQSSWAHRHTLFFFSFQIEGKNHCHVFYSFIEVQLIQKRACI